VASARRAGTNEAIFTYGSGQDYTLLSTWEAATDNNNTTGLSEVSISNVSVARFLADESLTFSSSGATATCRGTNRARTKMWYLVVTGTPTTADTITGATSGATADIDTIDSLSTGVSPVIECLSGSYVENAVALSGSTNDNVYFRIIRPQPNNFPTGVRATGPIFSATTVGVIINFAELFSQVQDLCGTASWNDGTNRAMWRITGAASGDNAFVGCIAYASLNSGIGNGRGFEVSINLAAAKNSFFVDCLSENNEDAQFLVNGTNVTAYLYNCTGIANTAIGVGTFYQLGGTAVAKNCLAVNSGTDSAFLGTFTMTNCASDDATAVGTSPRINQTFTFVNAGAFNYHLAAADAGAKGFGTDLSADATFAFTDDVDRQMWLGWSIGFDAPNPLWRTLNVQQALNRGATF